MSIDIRRLLSDHKIDFRTSGTEVGKGWIGINCPYCSDSKYHLGYHQEKNILTCWRCGVKKLIPTLSTLLSLPYPETKKLLDSYGTVDTVFEREKREYAKKIVLPEEFGCLKKEHRRYLHSRGFSPFEIESRWGILGTESYPGYSNRIIIPIYFQNRLVSFHSRDITGKAKIPKKACSTEKEVVHFRDTLYGYDYVKGNTVIVSEGPFDVWRWGQGNAVATFGIKFSERQVDLLTAFKNIIIVFDSGNEEKKEEQAGLKAEELADKLSIWHNVWIIDQLGSDPADFSQSKANRLLKYFNKLTERN